MKYERSSTLVCRFPILPPCTLMYAFGLPLSPTYNAFIKFSCAPPEKKRSYDTVKQALNRKDEGGRKKVTPSLFVMDENIEYIGVNSDRSHGESSQSETN